MAYGQAAAKKLLTAPSGGHGRAPARRTVLRARMRFALADPVHCVSRLRGLSSSTLILAWRALISFEGGSEVAVSVVRSRRHAHSSRREHMMNDAYPIVKKMSIFVTAKAGVEGLPSSRAKCGDPGEHRALLMFPWIAAAKARLKDGRLSTPYGSSR